MKPTNLIFAFVFLSGFSIAATQMEGTSNDVEVIRKIRQSLLEDKSLSVKAQNVTIMSLGNDITIKGTVQSKDEMAKVSSAAQEYAMGKTIKNELKVAR